MQALRISVALLALAAGIEAQVPNRAVGRGVPVGPGIANVPFVMFGTPGVPNSAGNLNGTLGWNWGGYYGSGSRFYPYLYYTGWAQQQQNLPQGPSYANPAAVQPIAAQPAPLQAPATGGTSAEWTDARTSFNGASVKVSTARQAVEELRARLAALGQSPRASLTAGVAAADAALRAAQDRMTAGNLEESLQEIQRANYLASQVLKEFGR